jgi:signal transduction histidine kinase
VLRIGAEPSVERRLAMLVEAARELSDAEYAALGVPDGEGGFAQFVTDGMSDEQIEAIGPLPRTHGLLGAMLESTRPYRTADVRRDPRFRGWPRAHPAMRSFLGVPIVLRGEVLGAFYLVNEQGLGEFDAAREEAVQLLAAHAAIAIENARAYERSRELSVLEERNRLARELHDAVSQRLFSASLAAEAAAALTGRGDARAGEEIARVQELVREALAELRGLIFELRPASLEAHGLVAALESHVDVLRRVESTPIRFEAGALPPLRTQAERHVLRVAQEALANALRHGAPSSVSVRLAERAGRLLLRVEDDGRGFDACAPAVRGQHLGLTSMGERAKLIGGRLEVRSAPGEGTTVVLDVPVARNAPRTSRTGS